MLKIIFFGSFQSYSTQVLKAFLTNPDQFTVSAVITTPPRPAGRKLKLKPTEVQIFSEENKLPVYPLESLEAFPPVEVPDFLVVAGYGKLIPNHLLSFPKIAPINVHFSLLPKFPGRCPAEWAILKGEPKTGVTIIKMSPEFDKGEIYSQEKMGIAPTDTRETLYKKLYALGGELATRTLPKIATKKTKSHPQDRSVPPFYARQITRDDGFIPFDLLKKTALATSGPDGSQDVVLLDRKVRAFAGWPGVWTTLPSKQRLKIISGHLSNNLYVVDSFQIEGKKPVSGQNLSNLIRSF